MRIDYRIELIIQQFSLMSERSILPNMISTWQYPPNHRTNCLLFLNFFDSSIVRYQNFKFVEEAKQVYVSLWRKNMQRAKRCDTLNLIQSWKCLHQPWGLDLCVNNLHNVKLKESTFVIYHSYEENELCRCQQNPTSAPGFPIHFGVRLLKLEGLYSFWSPYTGLEGLYSFWSPYTGLEGLYSFWSPYSGLEGLYSFWSPYTGLN